MEGFVSLCTSWTLYIVHELKPDDQIYKDPQYKYNWTIRWMFRMSYMYICHWWLMADGSSILQNCMRISNVNVAIPTKSFQYKHV